MAITLDGTAGVTYPVVAGGTSAVQASSSKILQVINVIKTDTFSTASTSFVDVTGLSVNITPSNSANKILVFYSVALSSNVATQSAQTNLVRNSTNIAVGDTAGSRTSATSSQSAADATITQQNISYLDSPATTSSTTYKVQMRTSAGTSYLNRSVADSDTAGFARVVSSITVMEIGA